MGSFRKNNFFSKVSLLITLLMIAVTYYGILPVIAEEVTLAPLNPAFFDNVQERQVLGEQRLTSDGKALGYIPSPLDLSHLKGSFLGQVHRLVGAPPSYDLRDLGKLTPVKDQGSCGSCWSFATFGSLESNLLPSETWNFSENNLKNAHGFDWGYCDGGNALISSAYLARWSGPIMESDDPYNPSSGSSPSGLTPQKHQQEILIIPDRAGPLDNENIKQMVMTYGALYTTMYYSSSYYNSTYKTYYYNGSSNSNHAVAIVGWDDSFGRSKFGNTPPGDGAFIIRNSWGASWGENGYFYISYYDSNIGEENFVFNYAESTTNYGNIYQYDPLGWVSSAGYGSNTAWFANIFTANESEQLSAVSFYTASPDAPYEIYIYTNVTSTPITGSLAGSNTGTISIPGYHTITLDSPVPITSGQKFSVVVKLSTPGYGYPIPMESREIGYSSDATAGAGQSYISSNGSSWSDITSLSWCTECNVCLKAFTKTGPSAPSATTNSATNITSVSATLNGLVNPNELSTTVFSQWGETTSYGNATSSQSVGSGTSSVSVSDNITGLLPNTTYHYRIVADNSAGTTYGSDMSFTTTPVPFSASGRVTISGGTGLSGVTMTFSRVSGTGTIPASVQTDSEGNWDQSGFQTGTTYRVAPSKSGYTFSPSSRDFSSDSTGLDYTGTIVGITVTVPDGGEIWQPGTTRTIRWIYSGSVGSYVKIELLKGGVVNRIITKSAPIGSGGNGSYNWSIRSTQTTGSDYRVRVTSMSNASYTDMSNNYFTIGTGVPTLFSISGRVATSTGTGISGVTILLTGGATGTTTTDSNGNYGFTGLANGSYSITPSRTGYTFTPTSSNATISGANLTGKDFTGTAATGTSYSISGTVTSNLGALSGATMTLSGDAAGTTATDGSGNFSFAGFSNGSYTITPSRAGCSFIPTSRGVTISGADVIGQNFTGKCKY